jgi:hypothetical protein
MECPHSHSDEPFPKEAGSCISEQSSQGIDPAQLTVATKYSLPPAPLDSHADPIMIHAPQEATAGLYGLPLHTWMSISRCRQGGMHAVQAFLSSSLTGSASYVCIPDQEHIMEGRAP